ncbi:3-phosphoshikimate 1-carboxyvinyltransferase [Candidatus Marinamargulisbacteria bacterium SCGC AAA071-K20]|nr:3-phosphoshikimate 1-carboxyvinyltransferase [Candidatus Marinamargulisbacteria bacterium SCGC AAA071-K20]
MSNTNFKRIEITIDNIPGDKSISHRAIILGSLAENSSAYSNFLFSEDCLNTFNIFRELRSDPTTITKNDANKTVFIKGLGLNGLSQAKKILDVGNSGTGIRLITGILASQLFDTEITGDSSIQKRPMKRIVDPLTQMGCSIKGQSLEGKNDIYPPLKITGISDGPTAIEYKMPVASAQVKSAILFASLFSRETTTIIEKKPSRNHTEIMLKAFGADITLNGNIITCSGKNPLVAPTQSTGENTLTIPSDFSSAAFFIVLALIRPNTKITLKNIGLNPTRATLIDVLKDMGAKINVIENEGNNIEPFGDIIVETSALKNITVDEKVIPFIIDEIPILAVAALFSEGTLKITNAEELRVKESDRIETTVAMIRAMGGEISEQPDGFELIGNNGCNKEFEVDSHGDHRIAMSAYIASKAGNELQPTINNSDCINTSFPTFLELLCQFS